MGSGAAFFGLPATAAGGAEVTCAAAAASATSAASPLTNILRLTIFRCME
jgi:hypothetical protein